jgi:four helix bundle protein
MGSTRGFDHERLLVYSISLEFHKWLAPLLLAIAKGNRSAAARHLDDASTSITNNIAEGNGKRSASDRCRFLDIARGSALECAACLDVLVARGRLDAGTTAQGKGLLVSIVSMLIKLTQRLIGAGEFGPPGG